MPRELKTMQAVLASAFPAASRHGGACEMGLTASGGGTLPPVLKFTFCCSQVRPPSSTHCAGAVFCQVSTRNDRAARSTKKRAREKSDAARIFDIDTPLTSARESPPTRKSASVFDVNGIAIAAARLMIKATTSTSTAVKPLSERAPEGAGGRRGTMTGSRRKRVIEVPATPSQTPCLPIGPETGLCRRPRTRRVTVLGVFRRDL